MELFQITSNNHTRKIFKNFPCDKYPELSKVNSMACEETNFWFGNYKYTTSDIHEGYF